MGSARERFEHARRRYAVARRAGPRAPCLSRLAGVLPRDLSRGSAGRGRHHGSVRPGEPVALGTQHAARPPLAVAAPAVQARTGRHGFDLRRCGRRASRFADLWSMVRRRVERRELPATLRAPRFRARLLCDERQRRRGVPLQRLLRSIRRSRTALVRSRGWD